MNTIVNTAALQPCQRAEASAHVLAMTWRDVVATPEVDFGGAVRLRDERTAVRAAVPTAKAVAAHTPGPVAWSPPPC